MLCKHQRAFFLHFCSTPVKIEKLDPAIPFKAPGLFYRFRGFFIYICIYIYIYIHTLFCVKQ